MASPSDDLGSPSEVTALRRERDLYRALLDLGAKDDVESFLEEALRLAIDAAGARRGYIELQDEGARREQRWWVARACSDEDVQAIRAAVSRGVIAEALASGRTVVTASALDDPRFSERRSVQSHRIEAVLCAPIGTDPPLGVVYMQDRSEPGPFSEETRLRTEVFARHLAAFADRLLARRQQSENGDVTGPYRQSLKLGGIIGRSGALAVVLRQIALLAPLEVGVLLTGPSGTGKTQFARIIHENGPRASQPFVELNCSALPEALVESELFGAMQGAHSTAFRRMDGKLAAAEGGTLFLDEVGELSLAVQSKLLQLLQSKTYYPLGSPRPKHANVRLIAATNADLQAAVAQRTFREDLYYRLQILPIRMPSLGERREDIPDLVRYFAARACESHHFPNIRASVGALRAAENAEWAGNVRQLGHAVEAAVILAAGDGLLQFEREHLFPTLSKEEVRATDALTFQAATRMFQEQLLRKTLEETSWNVVEAASRLDLARSHLYTLIRAHGLERRRS